MYKRSSAHAGISITEVSTYFDELKGAVHYISYKAEMIDCRMNEQNRERESKET